MARTMIRPRYQIFYYPVAWVWALILLRRLQTEIKLEPDEKVEVILLLGQEWDAAGAEALIRKYRKANFEEVLSQVTNFWDDTLGAIEIRTPEPTMDLLVNRWLLYQTISCRLWARAGFYQVSGAYGFRDQLQDVMALSFSQPELARAHILRAAARQFVEGDVQHWWLAETGQGIRTRISDDKAWLAYVTAHYVETTGDIIIPGRKAALPVGACIEV